MEPEQISIVVYIILNTIFVNVQSNNYFVGSTAVNWTTAWDYCLINGSVLASIHSESDNKDAIAACSTAISTERLDLSMQYPGCWFGLDDIDNEGVYVYKDGSITDYGFYNSTLNGSSSYPVVGYPWWNDQPDNFASDEDCLELRFDRGFQWNDLPCSNKIYPLCEIQTTSPTAMPSNIPSDIPTNTPITNQPTGQPTDQPSNIPSDVPITFEPTLTPINNPTDSTTNQPTQIPQISTPTLLSSTQASKAETIQTTVENDKYEGDSIDIGLIVIVISSATIVIVMLIIIICLWIKLKRNNNNINKKAIQLSKTYLKSSGKEMNLVTDNNNKNVNIVVTKKNEGKESKKANINGIPPLISPIVISKFGDNGETDEEISNISSEGNIGVDNYVSPQNKQEENSNDKLELIETIVADPNIATNDNINDDIGDTIQ